MNGDAGSNSNSCNDDKEPIIQVRACVSDSSGAASGQNSNGRRPNRRLASFLLRRNCWIEKQLIPTCKITCLEPNRILAVVVFCSRTSWPIRRHAIAAAPTAVRAPAECGLRCPTAIGRRCKQSLSCCASKYNDLNLHLNMSNGGALGHQVKILFTNELG